MALPPPPRPRAGRRDRDLAKTRFDLAELAKGDDWGVPLLLPTAREVFKPQLVPAERRRNQPVTRIAACTRLTGNATSVRVVSPRVRRSARGSRVRRKFQLAKNIVAMPLAKPISSSDSAAPIPAIQRCASNH